MAQPTPVVQVCGPWIGMRTAWRAPRDPQKVYSAFNMLPQVRGLPTPYVAMPYPTRTVVENGAAAGEVQAIGVFQGTSSEPRNVAIVAGEIWRDAGGWAKVVTAAQLAGAGIALAATGRVFLVPFGAYLCVTDGVNTPFVWDGTSGAGLTELTNAPVFYGRPTVYYGKLIAIKATERDTIVWSEENQPNVGYEAGGFNNAWSLTQTGGGQLYALQGTNAALYYFRADRCGAIRGAVTTDFQASGVHDDVGAVGTTDPEAVCAVGIGEDVWFLDQQGRPHVVVGTKALPVWNEIADIYAVTVGDYTQPFAVTPAPGPVVQVPGERLVFLALPFLGIVVYDTELRVPLAFYRPPGGGASEPGVAVRMGPQITGEKLQLGFGYTEDGDSPSGGSRVDRWPPYDKTGTDYYDESWGASDIDAAGNPSVVVGPLGIPALTTDWLGVELYQYIGRDDSGTGFSWQLSASPSAEDFQPGGFAGVPPAQLTNVGANQVVALSTTVRKNRRLEWGLRRSNRQLFVAFTILAGLPPVPAGVDVVIAKGQAWPTSPSKS